MTATRRMAAHYGLPPDHFDDWPFPDVDAELEVFAEIVSAGDGPLTRENLAALLEAAGIIKRG